MATSSRFWQYVTDGSDPYTILREQDPEVYEAICGETKRQREGLELIASENFVSQAVLAAQGCIMTNKYAEGYPAHRYYGGCEWVDVVERLAIERAKQVFEAEHANVQPHSGSQANSASYLALLQPGDTVLAMRLDQGGHLTHGAKVNFSGQLYNFKSYGVLAETEVIDYDAIEAAADENRPKMIVAGASAYPRFFDFERLRAIADRVGAYLLVDMAHIAGLVAAGLHPSPIPYADVVTTTTHKTLRGPRAGVIFSKEALAKQIDKAVFPGSQGGPLMHIIAAKAVAFGEALKPEFKTYQQQIIKNTRKLASELQLKGVRLVSGGSDNHLLLADMRTLGLTGRVAEERLGAVGMTVNKNKIPFDPLPATETSGIRVGTPAVTTRGMKEAEMVAIAGLMARALKEGERPESVSEILVAVREMAMAFPFYSFA